MILLFVMVPNFTLAHLLMPVTGTWFNSLSFVIEKDGPINKLSHIFLPEFSFTWKKGEAIPLAPQNFPKN